MSASRATSGGVAASSQFDNHADWIDMLVAAVLNTGATVGAATIGKNIGWKEQNITASGGSGSSGAINHGMPFTPSVVLTQLRGNPNTGSPRYNLITVSNVTSSTFTVYFGNTFSSGAWTPATDGQTITIDWLALP